MPPSSASKNHERRGRGGPARPGGSPSPDAAEAEHRAFPANPRRPNKKMLATSTAVMVAWLIYLLYAAIASG